MPANQLFHSASPSLLKMMIGWFVSLTCTAYCWLYSHYHYYKVEGNPVQKRMRKCPARQDNDTIPMSADCIVSSDCFLKCMCAKRKGWHDCRNNSVSNSNQHPQIIQMPPISVYAKLHSKLCIGVLKVQNLCSKCAKRISVTELDAANKWKCYLHYARLYKYVHTVYHSQCQDIVDVT